MGIILFKGESGGGMTYNSYLTDTVLGAMERYKGINLKLVHRIDLYKEAHLQIKKGNYEVKLYKKGSFEYVFVYDFLGKTRSLFVARMQGCPASLQERIKTELIKDMKDIL